MLMNQPNPNHESLMPVGGVDELPKPPVANRREINYHIIHPCLLLVCISGIMCMPNHDHPCMINIFSFLVEHFLSFERNYFVTFCHP